MAFERITDNIRWLNENVRSFAKSSAEYYKLELFNKTMKGATSLINGLVIGFFALFFVIFLSVAVAVLLSSLIGIPSIGFFIVAGFYLLLILIMKFWGASYIEKTMLVKTSRKVFNKEEEEEIKKTHPEFTSPTKFNDEDVVENERV